MRSDEPRGPGPLDPVDPNRYFACFLGGLVGGGTGIGVSWWLLREPYSFSYGYALFIGLPFLVGFASAAVARRIYKAPIIPKTLFRDAASWGLVVGLVGLFCLAMEGVLCIAASLPLVVPLNYAGAVVARELFAGDSRRNWLIFPSLVGIPFGSGFADHVTPIPVSAVSTVIEIDAPVDRVYEVATGAIYLEPPTDPFLKISGGYGKQSVPVTMNGINFRICEYSTGRCVQIVTQNDRNERYAARAILNPAPMREIMIRPGVHPEHLHTSTQMRSIALDFQPLGQNRTRLTRTTEYANKMVPAFYWTALADFMVDRIHRHKLAWVKKTAETHNPSHANSNHVHRG